MKTAPRLCESVPKNSSVSARQHRRIHQTAFFSRLPGAVRLFFSQLSVKPGEPVRAFRIKSKRARGRYRKRFYPVRSFDSLADFETRTFIHNRGSTPDKKPTEELSSRAISSRGRRPISLTKLQSGNLVHFHSIDTIKIRPADLIPAIKLYIRARRQSIYKNNSATAALKSRADELLYLKYTRLTQKTQLLYN